MSGDSKYFLHDSSSASSNDLLLIQSTFGLQGYALYYLCLEHMRNQDDLSIDRSLIKVLAKKFFSTKNLLEKFLNFCIENNIFSEKNNKISSEFLKISVEKFQNAREKRQNAQRLSVQKRRENQANYYDSLDNSKEQGNINDLHAELHCNSQSDSNSINTNTNITINTNINDQKENSHNSEIDQEQIENQKNAHDLTQEQAKKYKKAIETWNNSIANRWNLSKIQTLTNPRKSKLKARIGQAGGGDQFFEIINKSLEASSFLRGENNKGWKADFDFFLQEKSFTKAMEGSYSDKSPPKNQRQKQQDEKFKEDWGFDWDKIPDDANFSDKMGVL